MMNTIYSFAPFKRFDLGTHARVALGGGPRLGQNVFSNLLKDIGLPADIENLIANLPEAEKSFNRDKWNECKDLGLTTTKGAACALAVIRDINTKRQANGAVVAPPPASSTFPVVPVMLGLAAAGGLVWYLSSRK
jgi:hypothetical protein